ncbi:hypothetical protein NHX12_001195 [Muraenolepis orangiensis]|uniref:Rapunzel 4 n=1 Tax=Muraenolepis orangiensis TaxID=630683 RepID=A0A9Q0E1Z9_9TELE|nr:hypothetical protein NHX12_001195 [Muraenolepis orangiensis]
MTEQIQRFCIVVSENKDVVDAIMDVFEQGAEVVASIAGDLFPIFSIAAPLVRLALGNVESKEATFMKEQFQKVRERLEVMSEQIQRVNDEIKKSGADAAYFSVEENIINQFRNYMDILNAKPKYREVRKMVFLEHFVKTGGDKSLNTLFNAVTGDNFGGESVLEITLNYNEKSRRGMEDFCARLKKLFCIGLIALMGFTVLKDESDDESTDESDEKKILGEWGEKMKAVQVKMNTVIEDCIVSFPKQAEVDSRRLVRDHSEMTNQQLADALVHQLKKKYDWVYWSVRIFKIPKGLFSNKKDFHCPKGKSRFQVSSSDEKLNIMVSYSASPEPIDKLRIQALILGQKKSTVVGVAEMLFETLPGSTMVHTVKTSSDLACSWSFTPELHYWDKHNTFFVCAHSA